MDFNVIANERWLSREPWEVLRAWVDSGVAWLPTWVVEQLRAGDLVFFWHGRDHELLPIARVLRTRGRRLRRLEPETQRWLRAQSGYTPVEVEWVEVERPRQLAWEPMWGRDLAAFSHLDEDKAMDLLDGLAELDGARWLDGPSPRALAMGRIVRLLRTQALGTLDQSAPLQARWLEWWLRQDEAPAAVQSDERPMEISQDPADASAEALLTFYLFEVLAPLRWLEQIAEDHDGLLRGAESLQIGPSVEGSDQATMDVSMMLHWAARSSAYGLARDLQAEVQRALAAIALGVV